jgi:hypothetical protein
MLEGGGSVGKPGGVLIIIISTLTLQVHQALFLPLSFFPMCKEYSISEV